MTEELSNAMGSTTAILVITGVILVVIGAGVPSRVAAWIGAIMVVLGLIGALAWAWLPVIL